MSPSAQEAKEIGGARRWAHEHGHLVPVSDLDLEGKERHSEAGPGALGLEQQRLRGKSVQGPREATVGRPGAENSGFRRKAHRELEASEGSEESMEGRFRTHRARGFSFWQA